MINQDSVRAGTVVGETYEITNLLGQGGMGSVWAARHLRLPGKHVAIKFLHTAMATGEPLLRFRREAEIASRLGHPNIVEVLDFNTLPDGTPYLILELLEGQSLAARLRSGRVPLRSALDIARQIGSALHAAHRMKVVHRDLKPDNIFLLPRDVDGELRDAVKVLDFGISKIRGSETLVTHDAVIMGTPQYMSPEQASGKNQEVDQRTDIFALGAIVFEMLTGQGAFAGDSLASVIFNVVYQPHPSLATLAPETPPQVVAAVDRALAKSAADRFQDMASFVAALTGRALRDTVGPAGEAAPPESGFLETLPPTGSGVPAVASAKTAAPADSGLMQTMLPAVGTAPTVAQPSSPVGTLPLAVGTAPTVAVGQTMPATNPVAAAASVVSPVLTEQLRSRKQPALRVAGLVAIALALGGGLYALRGGHQEAVGPNSPAPTAPATTVSVEAVLPDTGVAAAPTAAGGPTAEKPPALVETGARPSAPTGAPKREERGGVRGRSEGALPPDALAKLEEAEAALRSGKAAEAIRLAEQSLYIHRSVRAFVVKTRARCKQGDLGGARAEIQHVSGPDRARVLRECKEQGIELK
jgi:eukaryotic-like serine/threonine-protein kinase